MWPDNETVEDLLGFQVHADLIRSVITNPRMLPLTIGVFGDWGGGKTSTMRMIERNLDPEQSTASASEGASLEKFAVVYFNSWLFEGYDDAKSAILSAVLLALSEHKRFGFKIRDKAKELLKSVNWMRIARLSVTHAALPVGAALMTGGAAALPAVLAASAGVAAIGKDIVEGSTDNSEMGAEGLGSTKHLPENPLDVRTFRDRFAQMLKDSEIETLVVLIDDLDRCTPERVVENLEAIKLFLNVDRTAFVIGADRRIVEHAIRVRYAERGMHSAKDEDSDRLVKDYLEKVIQVPYRLPRLSTSEIETYMVLLFCKAHLSDIESKRCLDACEQQRASNRYGTFGYSSVKRALGNGEMPEPLSEALGFCAAAAPLIADGLKGNPRQVKRFLNALLLRKELARVAKLKNVRDDVLVKLMILEYTNEKLFSQLFNWQAQQVGLPKQIAELEAVLCPPKGNVDDEEGARKIDAGWATTAIRRWIAMAPELTNIDLRDYFWVARDRLDSTFTGLSMVPPATRLVLEGLISGVSVRRNEAVKTAAGLMEDERVALLQLLDQAITRNPHEKKNYDALRLLVETSLPGALDLLSTVLQRIPTSQIPPAVGLDLLTLVKTKPAVQAGLQPAIDRLRESNDKVGTAIRTTLKGKQ